MESSLTRERGCVLLSFVQRLRLLQLHLQAVFLRLNRFKLVSQLYLFALLLEVFLALQLLRRLFLKEELSESELRRFKCGGEVLRR